MMTDHTRFRLRKYERTVLAESPADPEIIAARALRTGICAVFRQQGR
jgi:hypothetical protein